MGNVINKDTETSSEQTPLMQKMDMSTSVGTSIGSVPTTSMDGDMSTSVGTSIGSVPTMSMEVEETSKLSEIAGKIDDLGDRAGEAKALLIKLNAYFTSVAKVCQGDFSEIESKLNEWVSKQASDFEEVLNDGIEECFARIREPIEKALEDITLEKEITYRGITISLGLEFNPTDVDAVDKAAKIIFGKLAEKEEELKQMVEKGVETAKALSNQVIQDILGDSSESSGTDSLIGYQVLEFLGTAEDVAKGAATALRILNDVREGDGKLNATVSAEVDGVFSGHCMTAIEGKSFVDGIKLAIDSGFLIESSGELNASARAQLGETLYAQIEGQVKAFFKAEGSLKGNVKFGLFDGLTIEGAVSFEMQAAASASVSIEIGIGNVTIAADGEVLGKAGIEAKASGRLAITPEGITLQGKANFRMGAEVTASANLKVGEEFSLSLKTSAIAGLAAEVGGSFSIEGGKLQLSINLGAALGGGGALGLDVEIDLKAILEKLARRIEAYLMVRWKHRHLEVEGVSPVLENDISAVALATRDILEDGIELDLSPYLTIDLARIYTECLIEGVEGVEGGKPAMRPLPINDDDEFLYQLHLLCRGLWKRWPEAVRAKYKEKIVGVDKNFEYDGSPVGGINISDFLEKKLTEEYFGSGGTFKKAKTWDKVNKTLAETVNQKYGNVMLAQYNPSGSDMPLGKLDYPVVGKGDFEITRISQSPEDKFSSLDLGDYEEKDLCLVTLEEAIRTKGLNLNSSVEAQKSIRNIAEEYWEKVPVVLKDKISRDNYWKSGGRGPAVNQDMAEVLSKLVVHLLYTVSAPTSPEEKNKADFVVTVVTSSYEDTALSYKERMNDLWRSFFEDKWEKVSNTELNIETSQRLLDIALRRLHVWLREINTDTELVDAFDLIAEDEKNNFAKILDGKTSISEMIDETVELQKTISEHIKDVRKARSEYVKLAKKFKAGKGTKSGFTLEFEYANDSYQDMEAVDNNLNEASVKSLKIACESLLAEMTD